MEEAQYTLLKGSVWCLANLCRGKPKPKMEYVTPAFKAIATVIMKFSEEDILIDSCWTLYYLSDGGAERIPLILETGIVPRLVFLLGHQEPRVALPCLRVLGNISTGNDMQVEIIMKAGVVLGLKELIQNSSQALRKEACWVLSNLAAGSINQICELLVADVMPIICKILVEDSFEVKREALWIITNLTNKMMAEHCEYMVKVGVIDALVKLLSSPEPKALAVALQGLENMLKKAHEFNKTANIAAQRMETLGATNTLEQLQFHPNQMIYKMASDILENYFSVEDVEEILTSDNAKKEAAPFSIFNF